MKRFSSCFSGTSSVDLKSRVTQQQQERINVAEYQNVLFNPRDYRGEESARRSAAPSLIGEQMNSFQDSFWITTLNDAPLQPLQLGRAKSFQERRFLPFNKNRFRLSHVQVEEAHEPEFPNDQPDFNHDNPDQINDLMDATGVTPNFNYRNLDQLSQFPAFDRIKSFICFESNHSLLPSINFEHLTTFLTRFYKGEEVSQFDTKFTNEERQVILSFIKRKYRKDLKSQ